MSIDTQYETLPIEENSIMLAKMIENEELDLVIDSFEEVTD
jgi:hypothetical protein